MTALEKDTTMWVINMNGGTSERGQMRTGLKKVERSGCPKNSVFSSLQRKGKHKEASVSRPWEEDLSWAAEIIKQKDDVMLPCFTVWISEEILNQWSFRRAVEEEYAKPLSNTSSLKTLADGTGMEKGCPLVCGVGAARICICATCIIKCMIIQIDEAVSDRSFRKHHRAKVWTVVLGNSTCDKWLTYGQCC